MVLIVLFICFFFTHKSPLLVSSENTTSPVQNFKQVLNLTNISSTDSKLKTSVGVENILKNLTTPVKYLNSTTNLSRIDVTSNSTLGGSRTYFAIGVRSLGQKLYHISKEQGNWYRAMQHCRANNMRLATVNSQKEMASLIDTMKSAAHTGRQSVWISANDLGSTGKFYWISTGRRLSFSKWQPGQPNNHDWGNKGIEHCVEVSPEQNYGWNDFTCYAKQYFACEYFDS